MSKWEICCNCESHGKHSKHLGAITSEDRERDWSEDDFDAYLYGAYDVLCSVCNGTGKVQTGSNRVEQYYATDEEYYRKREGGY